ncbi:MAG: hypothetical protein JOS17DRAFT_761288 [Linnemannia elongata]|nr:MAG: hypothetical protein JOS17DRAFT_761288 [Linnemannia elongata]
MYFVICLCVCVVFFVLFCLNGVSPAAITAFVLFTFKGGVLLFVCLYYFFNVATMG